RWRRWARSASSRCASSSAAADTWPEVAGAPVVWASASGGVSTGGNATERKAEEDAPPPGETDPPPGSRGTPRSGKRKRTYPLLGKPIHLQDHEERHGAESGRGCTRYLMAARRSPQPPPRPTTTGRTRRRWASARGRPWLSLPGPPTTSTVRHAPARATT